MKALRRLALMSTVAATAAMVSTTAYAQSTTAGLRVRVVNENGDALANVPLTITHVPTGRTRTIETNSAGGALLPNLPVGGPYLVRVADGSSFLAMELNDIFLELGKTQSVTLGAIQMEGATPSATETQQIEEISVTGVAEATGLQLGAKSTFSSDDIMAISTISRDFRQALETDPKLFLDNTLDRGPGLQIAGSNFRFNSITVDGVAQNDNFGLNTNGLPTKRSPISIDAIGQVDVNVAPFDVTYGNFLGGNVNIVTKSGTNDFSGSAFFFYSDDNFAGNQSGNQQLNVGNFDETTWGGSFGGPIIEDKLFFFLSYERFDSVRSQTFGLEEFGGAVTQGDVDRVRSIAQSVYGFDPGGFDQDLEEDDEKMLVKIDWNINEDHRLAATYQRSESNIVLDDFTNPNTGVAALAGNRYDFNDLLNTYSVRLFSDWTDNFSTEIRVGYKDVNSDQTPFFDEAPTLFVDTAGGGSITLGPDPFRTANDLDNDNTFFRFKGDYYTGDHQITFGYERENIDVANLFIPFQHGLFNFASIDDFENRNLAFFDAGFGIGLFANSTTGNPLDAAAVFEFSTHSAYIQDTWNITDEFTVQAGMRMDWIENDDRPAFNPAFAARNGFSNTNNLSDSTIFMPRIGFNWQPSDRLTIRGGAGLFGGGTPNVWLSNSYSNSGVLNATVPMLPFITLADGTNLGDAAIASISGQPTDRTAADNLQPFVNFFASDAADTNAIDPGFEIISSWKFNFAVDYEADFSGIGLGDGWQFGLEAIWTEVHDALDYREGRRREIGRAPDGRPIYDPQENFDIILTNTGLGSSGVYTATVQKEWNTEDYGYFNLNMGYTYQDIDDVNSGNRFTAFEGFDFDATIDRNNRELGTSRFEISHRFTAQLNWEYPLLSDDELTKINLFYSANTGRRYTPTFGATGIFGGGGLTDDNLPNPGSQRLYIPTGINDTIVTGDADFLQRFNDFIDRDDCLSRNRGSVIERNECRAPSVNRMNIRILQEVEVMEGHKIELIMDLENAFNLFDSGSGRAANFLAPGNVPLVNVDLSADGTQYVYSSRGATFPNLNRPTINDRASVYRFQFGIRYKF